MRNWRLKEKGRGKYGGKIRKERGNVKGKGRGKLKKKLI